MAICIGLTSIIDNNDIQYIIVVTNLLAAGQKIINSSNQLLQKSIIPIAMKIKSFLKRSEHNIIQFWYYPSKLKCPQHALVDQEVKVSHIPPILPNKNLLLFSKKKEYNHLLEAWKLSFKNSKKRSSSS